jgi:hypothetical protein
MFGLLALFVFANFTPSGCSGKSETLQLVSLHCVVETPPKIGVNTVTCKLAGAEKPAKDHLPLTGARVSLEANMSHPGMRPAFGQAKETSPGTYVGNVELNMRGDWVVTAHLVTRDGQKIDQDIKVRDLPGN